MLSLQFHITSLRWTEVLLVQIHWFYFLLPPLLKTNKQSKIFIQIPSFSHMLTTHPDIVYVLILYPPTPSYTRVVKISREPLWQHTKGNLNG